ncbi:DNA-packaging protein [Escherichia coli]|nr:DNA-packaging protein [Escherichia coli]EGE3253856.1 DNA-packaging protein [Escherichia coli]KAB2530138.1 DNA-packaging protein [Escherichia coli]KUV59605.1 DNA-packaging protein [Escherichia coli]RIC96346.1 DNA-packaging protein [Escherichia coli]
MMPLCEMTVNDALVPAHNSKHHNRSDSILAVSDNYSRFRVLSVDPTGYGAATSRFFTIYENFSGKIVSVLLEYNFLFFLILHS